MTDLLTRLAVALAIGLLVGLERGWRERAEPDGGRTAGIRTYGLSGLLGGVFAALSTALGGPAVFIAGFLGFAAVFSWFQMREAVHEGRFSVTGAVAGLAVFALGGLAVAGDPRVAAAAGTALAGLLASRSQLHGLLRRMTWPELRSALVLAVMTTIVLPVLPDRAVDPWGGFNPAQVWGFTVLTAAISYLGYVAVRIIGPARGLIVGGLAGALVSSTAVTVAFGRAARTGGRERALAGGAMLAAMVSVLRVAFVVLLIKPILLVTVAPAALAAALAFGAIGGLMLHRSGAGEQPAGDSPARNPFDLVPLLAFAAGFALVSTASSALVGTVGSGSLVATAALSGAFDVDVAVLSAVGLAGGPVGPDLAGRAILAALAANAAGRLLLAIAAGPATYWLPLAGATLTAALAGALAHVLITGF